MIFGVVRSINSVPETGCRLNCGAIHEGRTSDRCDEGLPGLHHGGLRSVPVLQPPRGDEEPSGIVRVCQRGPLYGGVHGLHENEPDLSGRIYL